MNAAAGEAVRRVGTGWYLYGVVAANAAPARIDGGAVDPAHDVELVAEGPLAGVASKVSLEEFDEPALGERLRDAAWLEQKIRVHEQVLERVLADASVVPCRFCTVYRTEDELRRFLAERRDAIADALHLLQGRVEVGVKAFLDEDRFGLSQAERNDEVRQLTERASATEGGRAYLERRRLEQRLADELRRFKAEAGEEIHSRLLPAAEDGVALPLQPPELSGRGQEMVFNAAYLVGKDRRAFEHALDALAQAHRERGIDFELTGPWPPYNFVPDELRAS